MLMMIGSFLVLSMLIGMLHLIWSEFNEDERTAVKKSMLKGLIISAVSVAVLSVITYIF